MSRPLIHVLDNEPSVAEALAAMLRTEFDVEVSTSSFQFHRSWHARPGRGVLLDEDLDGDTGLEIAIELRKRFPASELCIAIISGVATANEDELRRAALGIGATYLKKPVSASLLLDTFRGTAGAP